MSFAQLFTTQIRNNVQSNSGLHLQCYRIFISKGGKEESAQLIGLTIPHFRSYSLLISQQCSKPHDFSCMFLPVPELAPVQRDPVDKSCNGRCQAKHQDCDNTGYHAKYSIAKITKINSLIRLNSLGTNPNLTILFHFPLIVFHIFSLNQGFQREKRFVIKCEKMFCEILQKTFLRKYFCKIRKIVKTMSLIATTINY